MGQVYIWDERSQSVRPREEVWAERAAGTFGKGGTIIKDIEPYRNVIDGEVIGGRKQHRDFLRARNMIEVGNDKISKNPPKRTEMPAALPDIKRAWDAVREGRAERSRFTPQQFDKF